MGCQRSRTVGTIKDTYEFPPHEFLLSSWGPICDQEGTPGASGSTDTKFSTVGVGARGDPARVSTSVLPVSGMSCQWHSGLPGCHPYSRGAANKRSRALALQPIVPKQAVNGSIEPRPPARPPAGPTSAPARGGRSPRPKSSLSLEEHPGGSQSPGGAAAWPGRQRACVLTDQPDSEHQLGVHCHNRSHLPPLPWAPHCRSHPSSWPRP